MKAFGEQYFEHTAYFNFDETEELKQLFAGTKNTSRLLGQLALYTSSPIVPQQTLLIFDEIQECNRALNSLKYFCENTPEYAIMAAGSLLGVSLSKGDSFPVGKVEFMQMYPLAFREFLSVDAPELLAFADHLRAIEEIPLLIFNRLAESFRRYQIVGGMPQPVSDLMDNKGMIAVEEQLQMILNAYALDFAKHADTKDIPRITAVWNSIPSQLSRENRKFLYRLVKPGARAREYENALLWLEHAGLVRRVLASAKPFLPLSGYDDLSAFKLYLSDTGLLRRLAKLPPETVLSGNPAYMEFKGAMTENIILQSLVSQFEVTPRYWSSDGKAEIDFLIQHGDDVIPVEVKSSHSVAGKGLSVYDKLFSPRVRIRYSMNNLRKDGNLVNIPLFLADWTKQILEK
jgi:predicted AAA+ superfamily ATPase